MGQQKRGIWHQILVNAHDINKSIHEGRFYNVVIPVRTFDKEIGQCEELKNAFRSTHVIPLQLRQFMTSSDRLDDQESISSTINPDITAIEMVRGCLQR